MAIVVCFILYFGTEISSWFKFFKQYKTPKIALTLNEKGITEHLQLKELGKIPWQDIEFVGIKNKIWIQYLIIKVKNPLEYINKANNNFKLKKLLRENYAKHQTPIVINVSHLDISSSQLRNILNQEWNKNKFRV